MRTNIESNQSKISRADFEQKFEELQTQENGLPKAAKVLDKLGKAEKALGEIEKNFDSIDLDKDGVLIKSELTSFADEKGVEIPSGNLERALSGSGLTRDGVEQLQGKVADAKSRVSSLAGLAERIQEKLSSQGALDTNSLLNLSAGSLGISGQSTEASLLASLFADTEDKSDDESSKSEESTNREFAGAKIRSYGTFGVAEQELLRATVA
jgi:hypothetical protein